MADLLDRLTTALADRYRVERELGAGGMATVYLAEDLKHHRQVAIKVLKPELAAVMGAERFLREIEIAARLQHPHILPLHDSGAADGLLYYVMPFVEGESLRGRLEREKQLPIDDAVKIAREVGDALSYAHSHDVIHRDIKPENVMLTAGHAVVADFGIARAVTAAGGDRLTETGVALGTPHYMSPEQAAGAKELDGRSDLYSLGCVLYEMLAGSPPFMGATVESVVKQHLAAEPPNVTVVRPAVPAEVVAVLARALAKTPADRFNPVGVFVEALSRHQALHVPSTLPSRTGRAWLRRALASLALLAVVAGAVILGRWLKSSPSAELEAAYPRTVVAVLPPQNLSADGPYANFAGGLHDELLTQLAKVSSLKPISRTSVMSYAGPDLPPLPQIASALGVGSVVEWSVQVLGDRLRVNVQLIDAATDEPVWAERYYRTLDDAFAIQSEIAQRVVDALGATLGASERQALARAPTANAEAYRLYLQGREYHERPGNLRQNYEIALQFYERALALDSAFALAHAALSRVHGQMSWFRFDRSPDRLVRQREAAETALRLAPDQPQSHAAMGVTHYAGSQDWQGALEEYNLALRGLPNDAELWTWIGYANRRLGHWEETHAAFGKATQLDPRSSDLFEDLGASTFRATRRYPEAAAALDQALLLAPDNLNAVLMRGVMPLLSAGALDSLRQALNRIPRGTEIGSYGQAEAWRALLLLLERKPDQLLAMLRATPAVIFEGQGLFLPTGLYAGWSHVLQNEPRAAQAAFESARSLIDSVIGELPDDWRVHASLGHAVAGLGRRQDALREARWLEESRVYRGDAFLGTEAARHRAWILAQVGEASAAIDEIERLLTGPAWMMSVHTLRLDPRWDPLRDDPRFQALLARYDPPQPVDIGTRQ